MSAIATIATAIGIPIIKAVIDRYVSDALVPITDKIMRVDGGALKDATNEFKHNAVLIFIKNSPKIMAIINKCGWSGADLDVIISFCVLIAKKSPTKEENFKKWNDDDMRTVFNLLKIIASKWFKVFKKQKK